MRDLLSHYDQNRAFYIMQSTTGAESKIAREWGLLWALGAYFAVRLTILLVSLSFSSLSSWLSVRSEYHMKRATTFLLLIRIKSRLNPKPQPTFKLPHLQVRLFGYPSYELEPHELD